METKKEKKMKVPHVLAIFVIIMLVISALTYIIPAGEYDRAVDETTGRTLVVAGSYHLIDKNPTTVSDFLESFILGMQKQASVIFFVLIIGGSFQIITATGIIRKMSVNTARHMMGKEVWVIPLFVLLFAIFGTTMAMSQELVLFVPLGVAIARSMGFDALTGTGMIGLGAVAGYSVGLTSPFNTGVAQQIAEVQLFSGMGYRAVLFVIFVVVTSAYIMRYAAKVKKNPENSIVYDLELAEEGKTKIEFSDADRFDGRDWLELMVLIGGLAWLVYGVAEQDWWFEQMSALFLSMGVVSGIVRGFGANQIAKEFASGAEQLTTGALVVGCAGAITVLMTNAGIMDTIIYGCATMVQGLPSWLSAAGMYVAQTIINFPIVSGSGQAAATMPIMTPLADLVGVSRQTAVLAFLLGDGFTNAIYPTSASMMTYIAMVNIPYSKWAKFAMPLIAIWIVIGLIAVIVASAIGY